MGMFDLNAWSIYLTKALHGCDGFVSVADVWVYVIAATVVGVAIGSLLTALKFGK